jgi:hypothetical protein
MKSKTRYLLALMALVAAPCTDAAEPSEMESGFGGRLSLGSIVANARTNMVSSVGFGLLQLSQAVPDSLNGQPKAHTGVLPVVALSLRYTFAQTGTQLFAGTVSGDALQFEDFLQGGVRQAIGSAGTVSLAYLYGPPVKVWVDPYVAGVARTETNRDSQGARLGWERVLGSGLQVQYTFLNTTIDHEASGSFLGLGPDDTRLLQRGGDTHQGEIRYSFTFAGAHQFTPAFVYTREDLHGKAMGAQGYDFKLRHALRVSAFQLLMEGSIGRRVHDEPNPVFGRKQADTRYSASATALYRTPFGWAPFGHRRWSVFATAGYTAADSNISFYSANTLDAGVGVSMEF